MPRLPVFTILLSAIGEVFRHFGTIARASLIPILLLMLLNQLRVWAPSNWVVDVLFWVAESAVLVPIAVAVHRSILLGPDSLPNIWSIYWTSRETGFLGWCLLLGIITGIASLAAIPVFLMLPDTLFGYSASAIKYLGIALAIGYLIGRFSMVLPATAIDKRMILSNSWYLTAENGMRISVLLLLPTLILVVFGVLGALSLSGGSAPALTVLLGVVLVLFVLALEIAVISLTYRFLRDAEYDLNAP